MAEPLQETDMQETDMDDSGERLFEESDLSALVANEIRTARRYDDEELRESRVRAIEYSRGEMHDVPPRPGGSKVTTLDVADTIAWMLPGVVGVFTASENIVEYTPQSSFDEEYVGEANIYGNAIFFDFNEGYETVYDVTHDAMLTGYGVVRHYYDATPDIAVSVHTGLTAEALMFLLEDDNVEILTQETQTETIDVMAQDPQGGEAQPTQQTVETYDVKIKRTIRPGKIVIESGRPENLLIDEAATSERDARFIAYRHENKTRSDLLEMGFDREVVDDLAADTVQIDSDEALARSGYTIGGSSDATQRSMQIVDLYDVYVKVDVDGDGIAETLQVWYAGDAGAGKVLEWNVWEDECPYTTIKCYPVPHRYDAESVADKTMDVQRVKTTLLRQTLDNIYASNMPMREVEEGSVLNPDILANPKFGGIIWKKRGANPLMASSIPFTADKSFPMLQYMDEIVEKRTGVSRATMALDPDALTNQTATASNNMKDAAYSQVVQVARNMAMYGGWKRVFSQVLKLIVKHPDAMREVKIGKEFKLLDPRPWNTEMKASINVGLGTGSKERDMAMLTNIIGLQREMASEMANRGFSSQSIAILPKIINTAKKLAEASGLSNPEQYFPDMSEEEAAAMMQQAQEQANKPDPEMEMRKAEFEAKMQLENAKGQAQVNKEQAQMEADLAVRAAERDNSLTVEQQRIASNERIERDKLEFKYTELSINAELKNNQDDNQHVRDMTNAQTNASKAESQMAKTHTDMMKNEADMMKEEDDMGEQEGNDDGQ